MKNFQISDWSASSIEQRINSTIAYINILKKGKAITNQQIIDATGIPESTFNKFMAGSILRPDWNNVIEIIRFLGGSVDLLCGLTQESEVSKLKRRVLLLENQLQYYKHHQLNALIVDDNQINIEILSWLMDERSVSYVIASDGQEAVNLFAESAVGTFDVILMDIIMPVMNGFEATKAIREMNRPDSDVSIIATTVEQVRDSGKRFFESGFDGYLYKPVDEDKLNDYLRKASRK